MEVLADEDQSVLVGPAGGTGMLGGHPVRVIPSLGGCRGHTKELHMHAGEAFRRWFGQSKHHHVKQEVVLINCHQHHSDPLQDD